MTIASLLESPQRAPEPGPHRCHCYRQSILPPTTDVSHHRRLPPPTSPTTDVSHHPCAALPPARDHASVAPGQLEQHPPAVHHRRGCARQLARRRRRRRAPADAHSLASALGPPLARQPAAAQLRGLAAQVRPAPGARRQDPRAPAVAAQPPAGGAPRRLGAPGGHPADRAGAAARARGGPGRGPDAAAERQARQSHPLFFSRRHPDPPCTVPRAAAPRLPPTRPSSPPAPTPCRPT